MTYVYIIIGVPFIAVVILGVAYVVGLPLVALYAALAGALHLPMPASWERAHSVAGPGQHIPPAVRRAVLQRDDYQCQECGATEELEMDHIIPKSRGGATTVENLQVLCHSCNMSKGVS
jgi:hypothetical protein